MQHHKVLLIEDNDDHAELLASGLHKIQNSSIEFVHRKNLKSGMEHLGTDSKFDVVFLDLNLPDSRGSETFDKFRKRFSKIPVVILTALNDQSLTSEVLSKGAQDYISKENLNSDFLERAIQYAIWRSYAELRLQQKLKELEITQEQLHFINAQLQESQKEYKELVNTIDGIVWEAQVGKPAFTFISRQVERLLGYPLERWLEEPGFWQSVLHEEDREKLTGSGYLSPFQKRDIQIEYRLVSKKGDVIWIRDHIKVFLEEGISKKMRGIMLDITEKKYADFEIRKAQEEMLKAIKVKSEFIANMSHEIRTPLNAIIGMASIGMDTITTPEQKDCLSTIKTSGDTLLALVNHVLDFSKIEAGKVELEMNDFKLSNVCKKVMDVVALSTQEKKIQLQASIDSNLTDDVNGDEGRILQILLNLTGNAIKFTPEQGVVALSVKLMKDADEGTFKVRFEVSDTGIGISEEAQKKLFQPFTQADASTTRKYGGTGLGLSICKHLVELMGGVVGLESKLTKDSTFWFEIPLRKALAPVVLKHEETHAGFQLSQGCKILVAEDNLANQKVIQRFIDRIGCTMDLVPDGQEAVSSFEKNMYDLIFMDCQMPGIDGYTATQKIRAIEASNHKTRVPIIALTAHAFSEDRRKCAEAGMDDYISKPFTLNQLEATIHSWIKQKKKDLEESVSEGKPAKGTPVAKGYIDASYIAELDQLKDDKKPDLICELSEIFFATTPAMLVQLKKAFEFMDLSTLERAAHSFKSTANNVGAYKLAGLLKEIEHDARGAKTEFLTQNKDNIVTHLDKEYAASADELKQLVELRPKKPS